MKVQVRDHSQLKYSMASIRSRTEETEAPDRQGARRAHTGSMVPTSNAACRDGSVSECDRIYVIEY